MRTYCSSAGHFDVCPTSLKGYSSIEKVSVFYTCYLDLFRLHWSAVRPLGIAEENKSCKSFLHSVHFDWSFFFPSWSFFPKFCAHLQQCIVSHCAGTLSRFSFKRQTRQKKKKKSPVANPLPIYKHLIQSDLKNSRKISLGTFGHCLSAVYSWRQRKCSAVWTDWWTEGGLVNKQQHFSKAISIKLLFWTMTVFMSWIPKHSLINYKADNDLCCLTFAWELQRSFLSKCNI